LLTALQQTRYM